MRSEHDEPTALPVRFGVREWLIMLGLALGAAGGVALVREEGRVTRAMLDAHVVRLNDRIAALSAQIDATNRVHEHADETQDSIINGILERQIDVRERLNSVERHIEEEMKGGHSHGR